METGVSRGDIELDHYNDHEVGCADPVFHRKIKGKTHYAYKNKADLLKVHKNARISDAGTAKEGDWVEARNGVMSQVVKKGTIGKNSTYIRTPLGQFRPYNGNNPISGEPHKSVYTFTAKDPWDSSDREIPSEMEVMFVNLIFGHVPREVAYMHLFKTNNTEYARERSAWLLKQKRIKKIVDEKLSDKMDKLNLTEDFILEEMYDSINVEKGTVKFNYLKLAAELRGMMPKEKTQTLSMLGQTFTGFTKERLKEFEERPALKDKNNIGADNKQ
jgi:hypothetical protein|tara:strand:+ start:897 stop:1715 length:819 start_codon:yes stop_codon:yes gene_type:complete